LPNIQKLNIDSLTIVIKASIKPITVKTKKFIHDTVTYENKYILSENIDLKKSLAVKDSECNNLKEDLDKIYHLLRGDTIGYNEKEELVYLPQNDPDLQPFNEYGVQIIMKIMSFYLTRNIILSNSD